MKRLLIAAALGSMLVGACSNSSETGEVSGTTPRLSILTPGATTVSVEAVTCKDVQKASCTLFVCPQPGAAPYVGGANVYCDFKDNNEHEFVTSTGDVIATANTDAVRTGKQPTGNVTLNVSQNYTHMKLGLPVVAQADRFSFTVDQVTLEYVRGTDLPATLPFEVQVSGGAAPKTVDVTVRYHSNQTRNVAVSCQPTTTCSTAVTVTPIDTKKPGPRQCKKVWGSSDCIFD